MRILSILLAGILASTFTFRQSLFDDGRVEVHREDGTRETYRLHFYIFLNRWDVRDDQLRRRGVLEKDFWTGDYELTLESD